ncbi:MAG: cupin domain-containing protein [Capsulimonadales bacterium]|nr:cupin domain-containing protein [Capsulimonadales bacterium]
MKATEVLNWDVLAEATIPSTGGAVLRRFFSGERLTMARVTFEAGAAIAEHVHENEQMTLVLSGRMEFLVAGKATSVSAGEVIYLPANVPHAARAIDASVLMDVFSPPRADWAAER